MLNIKSPCKLKLSVFFISVLFAIEIKNFKWQRYCKLWKLLIVIQKVAIFYVNCYKKKYLKLAKVSNFKKIIFLN